MRKLADEFEESFLEFDARVFGLVGTPLTVYDCLIMEDCVFMNGAIIRQYWAPGLFPRRKLSRGFRGQAAYDARRVDMAIRPNIAAGAIANTIPVHMYKMYVWVYISYIYIYIYIQTQLHTHVCTCLMSCTFAHVAQILFFSAH